MANPEHLAVLEHGVEYWNQWRKKQPRVRPDLSGTKKLRGVNLKGIDFRWAILRYADLRGVNLTAATLEMADLYAVNLKSGLIIPPDREKTQLVEKNIFGANLGTLTTNQVFLGVTNLCGANLQGAILIDADLQGIDMSEARMFEAVLRGAIFNNSNLDRTDFDHAELGWTTFGNVNLSVARNLHKVRHYAPSIVGIETIHRSGGNIPESFLRGCGVPETFITYARSLVGKPINFYSCFISHSSKDKRFCERFYADLQANGVRVWYFPEDAKWGEPVWGEIDRSIKVYDKLIIVCSKNALTSVPVQREIERALNREDKEHKNILFPITIDDYIFDEWEHPRKADVLAKIVGDFRGWNRNVDKYAKACKKFLKALKAE
jgi:hypothetical protein